MLNELYDIIKDINMDYNINPYMEFVEDIEYYDELIEGIVIYFPNGEALQIFIENNKITVLDENIAILIQDTDLFSVGGVVVDYSYNKITEINSNKNYIQF